MDQIIKIDGANLQYIIDKDEFSVMRIRIDNMLCWSENKEDLEIYINSNKYNI